MTLEPVEQGRELLVALSLCLPDLGTIVTHRYRLLPEVPGRVNPALPWRILDFVPMSLQLGDLERWVELKYERISGRGRVIPRIVIAFEARTIHDQTSAELHDVTVRLAVENEVIGEGRVGPEEVWHREAEIEAEIPTTRGALTFLDERLKGHTLDLVAHFTGWMRMRGEAPHAPQSPWQRLGRQQQAWLPFQVARSDWFTKVLQPMGIGEYVIFEMPIPLGALRQDFQKALDRLADAERHYWAGSDPSVFSACRGAIDALPDAKKHIFDKVGDERKRKQIDALATEIGNYLHTGRHIALEGEQQGEFPVDHRDAEFALAMTRMLIAYTAKLLTP